MVGKQPRISYEFLIRLIFSAKDVTQNMLLNILNICSGKNVFECYIKGFKFIITSCKVNVSKKSFSRRYDKNLLMKRGYIWFIDGLEF